MTALADFQALSADEVTMRLAASPEERAALIRAAAEGGVAEAQALFGQLLLDGDGVPRNATAALGWFAQGAAQNHPMSINMVGRCYDLGWGTAIDKARAASWYEAAALRGLDWAMYNYATLLALGHGVAQDRPTALAWFRKAASLGNGKAMNFVGSFHEDGWVVPRNLAEAAVHYARAAARGDFRGQFNHARMLALAGDHDSALTWLARVPDTANARFLTQVRAWLETQDQPLRTPAITLIDNAIDSHYHTR